MNRVKAFRGKLRQPTAPPARTIPPGLASFHAKPLGWLQFAWDLAKVPQLETKLPEHYQIGRAVAADTTELRKLFSSCFMLDPVWSPAIGEVMHEIQALLDNAFDSESKACLALRHGARIIGATLISLDPNIDNQLAPGPSVLIEYRNRSFGTLLLERSLALLREGGFAEGRGIVRDMTPGAKFLYPKFGGVAKSVDAWAPAAA